MVEDEAEHQLLVRKALTREGSGFELVQFARDSDEALRFSRARGASCARASVLQLPFTDGAFDLVTSFDVLYHRWVTDDRAAVAELARVLRPGGLLFVRVPALRLLWGAHDEAVLSRHRYRRGVAGRGPGGEGGQQVGAHRITGTDHVDGPT